MLRAGSSRSLCGVREVNLPTAKAGASRRMAALGTDESNTPALPATVPLGNLVLEAHNPATDDIGCRLMDRQYKQAHAISAACTTGHAMSSHSL